MNTSTGDLLWTRCEHIYWRFTLNMVWTHPLESYSEHGVNTSIGELLRTWCEHIHRRVTHVFSSTVVKTCFRWNGVCFCFGNGGVWGSCLFCFSWRSIVFIGPETRPSGIKVTAIDWPKRLSWPSGIKSQQLTDLQDHLVQGMDHPVQMYSALTFQAAVLEMKSDLAELWFVSC